MLAGRGLGAMLSSHAVAAARTIMRDRRIYHLISCKVKQQNHSADDRTDEHDQRQQSRCDNGANDADDSLANQFGAAALDYRAGQHAARQK
jgi:hypothetical protein